MKSQNHIEKKKNLRNNHSQRHEHISDEIYRMISFLNKIEDTDALRNHLNAIGYVSGIKSVNPEHN